MRHQLPILQSWFFSVTIYILFIASGFSLAAVEFATGMLLLLGLFCKKNIFFDTKYFFFVMLWFGVVGVSTVVHDSWREVFPALKGDYRLLLPLVLPLALGTVDLKKLLKIYLIGMGLMAIYGIIQHFYGVDWFRVGGAKLITPYPRVGGTVFHAKGNFSHHLTYAGVMLMNVPLFLSLAIHQSSRERWTWGLGAVLCTLALVFSLSRSGWLGGLAGMSVLIFLLPRRRAWRIMFSLGCFGILVISLMGSGWLRQFYQPDHPQLLNRLLLTSLEYDQDRWHLWQAAWMGIEEHPWLGVGLGNEVPAFEHYRQGVSTQYQGYVFNNKASAGVHNQYLQILFSTGVLGLLAHLLIFGVILHGNVQVIQKSSSAWTKGLGWGLLGGICGHLTAGIFDNNFFDSEVQNLVMVFVGILFYLNLPLPRLDE
ncbi:MAG: O-antigen ligase family protein [SAR324 cluster bacterium]|nr:O-antigen ligase family protein [SAR324 cluster bacterium]